MTKVLDALDIRLEPKYNSDIVPIALTAKGAINQRSSKVADENIIYQLIEHNKKNFIETASHIMDGHTEVAPLSTNKYYLVNFVIINQFVM